MGSLGGRPSAAVASCGRHGVAVGQPSKEVSDGPLGRDFSGPNAGCQLATAGPLTVSPLACPDGAGSFITVISAANVFLPVGTEIRKPTEQGGPSPPEHAERSQAFGG